MPKQEGDDAGADDDKKTGPAPTLEQVHDIESSRLEDDGGDDGASETKKAEGEEDGAAGTDAGDEGKDTDDDEDKGGADDGKDSADDDQDEDKAPASGDDGGRLPDTKPAESTAELNTDIKKPGEGKVAIKNADGETFYFNSTEEVPDDFEPVSYKALMEGTKALMRKEDSDAQAAKDADEQRLADESAKRAKDMQDSWDKDVKTLTDDGVFPKDPKENEAMQGEVLDYISDQLKKGRVLTDFSQAYKAMMYDKEQVEKKTETKKKNDTKSKRGSVVQGGSGGSGESNQATGRGGGRVLEAPPSGAGLDAVHQRATADL
jgi:hypothetical protein